MKRLFSLLQAAIPLRRVAGGLSVLLLSAVVCGVGVYLYQQQRDLAATLAELSADVNEQSRHVSQMQSILAELDQADTDLKDQLAALQEGRSETQNRLASLTTDVQERQQRNENRELTNIVQTWNDRVAHVTCTFDRDEGGEATATASGVAAYIGGDLTVITNRHLVAYDDGTLDTCEIAMPQHDVDNLRVRADRIRASEERDVAYLNAGANGVAVPLDRSRTACTVRPDIGDRVVTLGFPKVGSEDSITVTDGIISGFEEDFYITSAKIERGNSGGAAILVKNNCFLGLPTLVVVGRIESLARILPIDSLTRMDP